MSERDGRSVPRRSQIRNPVVVSVVGAVALVAVMTVVAQIAPLSVEWQHALRHSAFGAPAWLLLVLALRTWPKPAGRAVTIGRRALLVGLAAAGTALTLEAIAAFGYQGEDRVNWLATLHAAVVPISPLALILALAGAAISLTALAVRGGTGPSPKAVWAVIIAVIAVLSIAAVGRIVGL
jgi:hypothetical protein